MTIWVSARSDNTSHSLTVDTHEIVGVGRGLHGVNGDTNTSVGTILESDREGGARSEFSVELRLGRSGSNRSPGDTVGDELGAGG